jgi:HD-GYP domain-containing protein (c-di-GMP phosphodiesterase class II)
MMDEQAEDRPTLATLEADAVLVDGLVAMMRQRDPVTAAHLDAVGLLAKRLATTLELEPVTITRITTAARLHDIGKQTVSLDILNKPGVLDDAEWAQIRQHPDFGANIVAGFPQLEKYRLIVRAHHERIDGRGYPDGLVGNEIPYEARLIAVVDAFHAMTVSRPYSRVRTPALALAELMNCSGTQFEPEYVDAFVRVMGYRARSLRSA